MHVYDICSGRFAKSKNGRTGVMFPILGVIHFRLYIATSQKARWIIASAEYVCGAERKFHQKKMKLLFFLGYEQCLSSLNTNMVPSVRYLLGLDFETYCFVLFFLKKNK